MALFVVFHHAAEESVRLLPKLPEWLILAGASGVDLFFVLSGFLMVYTTEKEFSGGQASRRFVSRRFYRIFPTYWSVVAAMFLLHSAGAYKHMNWGMRSVLETALLIPEPRPIVGVSWTLSFEVYFYLIFAIGLGLVAKKRRVFIVGGVFMVVTAIANFWALGGFLSNTMFSSLSLGWVWRGPIEDINAVPGFELVL